MTFILLPPPPPPQVSDLMVMDVWQASLMRAFAQLQLEREQGGLGEGKAAREEDAEEAAAFELFEAQQAALQQADLGGPQAAASPSDSLEAIQVAREGGLDSAEAQEEEEQQRQQQRQGRESATA